jgi:DNA-binding transcriptional regulator GbsR (MarR family)
VSAHRDDEAVKRYAEQFGNLLADTGWPRMAARVFAAILASEDGRMTAADLSDQLQASPAAVSGAVNYLLQMRLASREREPGSRRDVYVVQDDFWYQSMMRQDAQLVRWSDSLKQVLPRLHRLHRRRSRRNHHPLDQTQSRPRRRPGRRIRHLTSLGLEQEAAGWDM